MSERLIPGATVRIVEDAGRDVLIRQGTVDRLRGVTIVIALGPHHRISVPKNYPGLELQPIPPTKPQPPLPVQYELPNF